VTDSGRFDLGPYSHASWELIAWPMALAGDEIHLLEGCNMPMLLCLLDELGGNTGGASAL
jgi:hypothetical protein